MLFLEGLLLVGYDGKLSDRQNGAAVGFLTRTAGLLTIRFARLRADSRRRESTAGQDELARLDRELARLRGELTGLRGELASLRGDVAGLTDPVDELGRPNLSPGSMHARNEKVITWNIKNFGYEMARSLEAKRKIVQAELRNLPATSRPTLQADVESPWFAHWCNQLHIPVSYHRKNWELCFLLQSLHDQNLLVPGKAGLGFACGREPIPSYLASLGIRVTATDQPPEQVLGKVWAETGQHAASIDDLWYKHLVTRRVFDKHVSLQFVDMNKIPSSLRDYDFCWSVCAVEHLGSIEQGVRFLENSLNVLSPGGIAIHTMEYNVDNGGPTINNWGTVLFQRKHIENVAKSLSQKGHRVAPLNFDFGDGPLDNFIDMPPYIWPGLVDDPRSIERQKHPSHLKLSIDGFVCTCFGIIIQRKT